MPTSGCFLASTACVSSVTMWLHRIWSYLISRVQLIDLQLIIEYSLSNKHFRCNLEWKSPYVLYMLNSSHQFKCECAFRMQVFLTWYLLSRFSFYCREDADIGVHAVNAIKDDMEIEIQKQYFYLESQSRDSIAVFLEPRFTDNFFPKQMCDVVNPCKKYF